MNSWKFLRSLVPARCLGVSGALLLGGLAAWGGVASAVSITTQPRAVTVGRGGNAVFTVTATGTQLAYQWYRGASGDTSAPVAAATGPLFISPPLAETSSFWVRVSDATETADSAVAVVTPAVVEPATMWGQASPNYGELGIGLVSTSGGPAYCASDVVSIATGSKSTHFIKADGTLWGTGVNTKGQLGDGSTTQRVFPVPIAEHVKQVAAGYEFTLFVKEDGTLWATGDNFFGQLGDGTTEQRLTPVQVATGVAGAAAGVDHAAFIKTDGSLWFMGDNGNGRFCNGSPDSSLVPVQVATGVSQVALGSYHSLFIKTDGTLWGSGDTGSFQASGGPLSVLSPLQIASDVVQISAGRFKSYYLRTNGDYWIGGYGITSTGMKKTLTGIARISGDYVIDASGALFTRSNAIVIAPKAGLVARGEGQTLFLELRPAIVDQPDAITVLAGQSATLSAAASGPGAITYQWYRGAKGDITQPVAGATNSTLQTGPLLAHTSYWVRASNAHGSTDSNAVLATAAVQPVVTALPGAVTGYPGAATAIRVEATGGALTYQWYAGNPGDTSQPLAIASTALLVVPEWKANTNYWVRITNPAGSVDSAAVFVNPPARVGGLLRASGGNLFGKLGDGTTVNKNLDAVTITSGVVEAAGGTDHSLFVKSDGTLWATGRNTHGQFGNGLTSNSSVPLKVASGVRHAAAGSVHSLFVKTDGTLWATGNNTYGQLGTGNNSSRTTPIQIASDVVGVSAGPNTSFFIKTDGSLWAMGYNSSGRLGTGDTVNVKTPVQVATGVAAVEGGDAHTLFVKRDGTLWAMGSNSNGRLGDGTQTNRLLPVQIAEGAVLIATGSSFSMHVKNDGSVWCNGSNLNYMMPTFDSNPLLPVKSPYVADATALAAGDAHAIMGCGPTKIHTSGFNNVGEREIDQHLTRNPLHFACGNDYSFSIDPLPVILTQPLGHAVLSGAAATLKVIATEPETASYQWYAGNSGNTGNPIAGATASQLTTGAITAASRFWVRVSNPFFAVDSASAEVTPTLGPPQSFSQWAAAKGLGAGADPAADPDRDRLPNLLEYAFNLDPTRGSAAAVSAPVITAEAGGKRVSVNYRRSTLADVELGYFVSEDLDSWTAVVPTLELIAPDADGDGKTELIRASFTIPAAQERAFIQIAAE